METKYIYRPYSFDVTEAEKTYNRKFDLDKNITKVIALQLTCSRSDQLFNRGSMRIEISGDEIFPEDFDSKALMSGLGVCPNTRFFDLGNVQPGNGEIKILYKDSAGPVVFAAYKVKLLFKCEIIR